MSLAAPTLPYVKWPIEPFSRHLEGKATELRRRLNLSDDEPLDPFELLRTVPNIVVIGSDELEPLFPVLFKSLQLHSHTWSAAAYREVEGTWLILYNSTHSSTRINVSLLEEYAHIHLKHPPSKVMVDEAGMHQRTYSKSKEKEAYGVAAAALVPFPGLVRRIADGRTIAEIGGYYGASEPLVSFRINTTKANERAKRLPRMIKQ